MKRTVRVFTIPKERVPGGPPNPAREVAVEASSLDGVLAAARAKLIEDGHRIRTLSFSAKGLVAYVEEPE
jgi:hypothetical protein